MLATGFFSVLRARQTTVVIIVRDRACNMQESLAATLQSLASMLDRGLLTVEEFQLAKQSALSLQGVRQSQPTTSTTSVLAAESPQNNTELTCSPPQETYFTATHTAEHDTAFRHLTTILTNLLKHPTEDKFKILRLGNDVLRSQLFHILPPSATSRNGSDSTNSETDFVSASELFLQAVGFRRERRKKIQLRQEQHLTSERVTNEGEDTEEDVLVFVDDAPTSPSVPSYRRIQDALAQIDRLKNEDLDARKRFHEFQVLKSSVAMDVRRDALQRAVECGEVESFCCKLLCESESVAGDDFVSVLESLSVLEQVLRNIAADPSNLKFRTLKFSNKLVHRALVVQRGALEFLLGVVGFEIHPLTGEVVLQGDSQTAAAAAQHGLMAAASLRSQLCHARDKKRMEEREAALQAAREEVKKQVHAERNAHRLTSSVKTGTPASSGKRVTMTEALSHLLGRDTVAEAD